MPIHRAAGPELLAECRTLGGCPTGDVRPTGAYRLPARWIIHAVGPVWRGGTHAEADLLASCYRRALEAAGDLGARSIAFPAISTGVYRYPPAQAAAIAVDTAREAGPLNRLDLVLLVAFDRDTLQLYEARLAAYS